MSEEEWRSVPNFEGRYWVSNRGRVKGPRGMLASKLTNRGYYAVGLYLDGRPREHKIHRLVAAAFVPNPQGLPEVNHKDCCKLNNTPDNLEWVSSRQNMRHAIAQGRQTALTNPNKRYKLTPDDVAIIRAEYRRGAPRGALKALADRFNIDRGTVLDIAAGRSWYDPSLGIPPPQPRKKRPWRGAKKPQGDGTTPARVQGSTDAD